MPFPNPDTQFKPGQSGNPDGKPKGRRSLATVVRDFLESEIDWEKLPLKDSQKFSEQYPGKTAGEALVITAFGKALDGDSAARDWLRRSGYGDKVDITSDDKPIPILGVLNVSTNPGSVQDSAAIEADTGDSGGNVSGQDDSDPDAADTDSPDPA